MSEFSFKDAGDIAFSAYGGINPVFGNIYSGVKNAEATREKGQLVDDYESNINTWFNNAKNQDFLQTSAAKGILTRLEDNLRNANQMQDKQAATTGATNEAVLAAKSVNQDKFNEGAGTLAAAGTARQDAIEASYMKQLPTILQAKTGILDNQIAAAQTQQQNNGNTMNGIMSLLSDPKVLSLLAL
jgi:hypothetical protein